MTAVENPTTRSSSQSSPRLASPFSTAAVANSSSPSRGFPSRNNAQTLFRRHVSELHLEQRDVGGDSPVINNRGESPSSASPPSRDRSQAKLLLHQPRSREASFHSRLFSTHGGSPAVNNSSSPCASIFDASASPSEASDDGMLVLKTAKTRNRNRESEQRNRQLQQQKKTRRSTLGAAEGLENHKEAKQNQPTYKRGSLQALATGPLCETNGNGIYSNLSGKSARPSFRMSVGQVEETPVQAATSSASPGALADHAQDVTAPAPRASQSANNDGVQLYFSPESTQDEFSPTQLAAKPQDDTRIITKSPQPIEHHLGNGARKASHSLSPSSAASPSRNPSSDDRNQIDLTDSPEKPSSSFSHETLSARRRAPLSPSASPRNSFLGGGGGGGGTSGSARRPSQHRRTPSTSAAIEKSASSHSMTPNRSEGSSAPDSGTAQVRDDSQRSTDAGAAAADKAESGAVLARHRGAVLIRDFAFPADDDRYHGRGRAASMAMTSSSIDNDDGAGPSNSSGFMKGVFGGGGGGGGHGRRKSSFGAWGGFSLGGFAWGRNKGQDTDRSATSSPDVVIPSISDLTPSSSVEPQGYLSPSIAAQREGLDDSVVDDDDEDGEGFEDEDQGSAPLPEGSYRVIYPFESEGAHEMSVKEGEVVRVKGRLGDGWVIAERLHEGQMEEGLVPESYLQLADDSLDTSES